MSVLSYDGKTVHLNDQATVMGTVVSATGSQLSLGTAENFDVLAGSAITNTGNSVISGGDLGLYPGTSVTGFPPGVVTPPNGEHITDAVAQQAQIDALAAYNLYSGMPAGTVEGTLDGLVLTPGTYTSVSIMLLNVGQTLTLNGAGIYIFQVGSALTIGVGATVLLTGGAQASNVIWVCGTSATINGPGTTMVGTVIALSSITLGGGSFIGRGLALNGALTIAAAMTISSPSVNAPGASALVLTIETLLGDLFTEPSTSMYAKQHDPGTLTSWVGKRVNVGDRVNLSSYVSAVGTDAGSLTRLSVVLRSGQTVSIYSGTVRSSG